MSLAEALRAEAAAVESQLALLERLLVQLRAAAVTAELLEADTEEPVLSIEDLAEMGRESARQFARRKEEMLLDEMREPDGPSAEALRAEEQLLPELDDPPAPKLTIASYAPGEAEPDEFVCDCGREFTSKQGLTMHVRRAHEGYNPRAGTPNKPKAKSSSREQEPQSDPMVDGPMLVRGHVFECCQQGCDYRAGGLERLKKHTAEWHQRMVLQVERTPVPL